MPVDSGNKFSSEFKNSTTNTSYADKKYTRTSFLLLNDGGGYQAYVMMIMADPAYVNNDLTKLAHNTYRKLDADFSGLVLYFKPDGRYIGGYKYINGQMITPPSVGTPGGQLLSLKHGKAKQTTDKLQTQSTCTDYYLITFYDDGSTDSEYLGEVCNPCIEESTTGCPTPTGGGGGGSGVTTVDIPAATCGGASSGSTGNESVHLGINNLSAPPTDGGAGAPNDPCTTTINTGIFRINNSNAEILQANFNAFLAYAQSCGATVYYPYEGTCTYNGVTYTGQITQILDSSNEVVATYFTPDTNSSIFQTGIQYNIGNGETTLNSSSSDIEYASVDFGNPAKYLGSSSGSTNTITYSSPPEGFRPLCKSSIVLKPSSGNSSEVNMAEVFFGIVDMPHLTNGYQTKINVIEFNLYISIPNSITDPLDRNKTVIITPAMQREFIYLAYHYASEQTNLEHGLDFFSVAAQPKYSALFAANLMFYLTNIALEGEFPDYQNANNGQVPPLGARCNTNQFNPSKATIAVYTNGPSGEGC